MHGSRRLIVEAHALSRRVLSRTSIDAARVPLTVPVLFLASFFEHLHGHRSNTTNLRCFADGSFGDSERGAMRHARQRGELVGGRPCRGGTRASGQQLPRAYRRKTVASCDESAATCRVELALENGRGLHQTSIRRTSATIAIRIVIPLLHPRDTSATKVECRPARSIDRKPRNERNYWRLAAFDRSR